MFDWIADIGQGVINIFSGKSWNGDDPNKIKADAQAALAQQQQAYQAALNAQSEQLSNYMKSIKNTVLLVGAAAGLGVGAYMIFGKGRRRR